MAKKKQVNTKKYLNALGTIYLILGCLIIVAGLVFMFINVDLTVLDNAFVEGYLKRTNGDMRAAQAAMGLGFVIMGVWQMLLGWLQLRAAKNPEKSVLVFILTMMGTVTGMFTLFNSDFSDNANIIGSIVLLTMDMLSLSVLYKLRVQLEED